MKFRLKLSLLFFIVSAMFLAVQLNSPVQSAGTGSCKPEACSCDNNCTGPNCSFQGCCAPYKGKDENGNSIYGECIAICNVTSNCPAGWTESCKKDENVADTKIISCPGCSNTLTCYKCESEEPAGATNTPPPTPLPTVTPIPTKTPTPTPTPPQRQNACLSTTTSKTILKQGESATLTSTFNSSMKTFYFAFYNFDNLYGPGNAKPICVKTGGDFPGNTSGCPAGSHHLIYLGTVKDAAKKSGTVTVSYSNIFVNDENNAGKPVLRASYNAYAIDNNGMSTLPKDTCVGYLSKYIEPTVPGGVSGSSGGGSGPPGGGGSGPPGGGGSGPPGGGGSGPPGGGGSGPPGGGGSGPPGGGGPTPILQCGQSCNPNQPNECPQECPYCPFDNPKCIVAPPGGGGGTPPPGGPTQPPGGGPTPKLQCGQDCNPNQPNECPQECPYCPFDNPKCIVAPPGGGGGPTVTPGGGGGPTVTPGGGGGGTPPPGGGTPPLSCGEPCSPGQPDQCPDECPSCPEANPVCQIGPTPPAACDCDSVTYSGEFTPGKTVKITTFAVSLVPETTEVLYMVYHVEKDGVEIATSDQVRATIVPGSNERYETSWNYTIPEGEDAPGQYRIWVKITCARKSASTGNTQTAVLGEETEGRVTLLDAFMNFINRFFFLNKQLTPQAVPTPAGMPGPDQGKPVVLAPSGARTLQLGTFHAVVNLKIGCKEITFTIL